MTAVKKQDSNFTGLAYAVEVSPGVVDGTVTWIPLEPNSYKNFGGDVKTKQRMPINATRQLKKGVVVDLDAAAGFIQDLTADNFQDVSQCFMYAALRTKNELKIATVGASHDYDPASGGDAYYAGDLLFAKGFAAAANNGLKVKSGVPATASVVVTDTGVTAATTQTGVISCVGYQFNAGDVAVDVSGGYPALVVTNTKASSTLTVNGGGTEIADGYTVTIGDIVYTFQSAASPTLAYHVHIGASDTIALTNLYNCINGGVAGVAGTDFGTSPANPFVTATSKSATTLVVTAIVAGTVSNTIVTTATGANWTAGGWAGATLNSGTPGTGGRGFDSFGLIPGEFVFVGDDTALNAFLNATNNGFARVRSITQTHLTLDKTQNTMVVEAGTLQTLRIYFGRVLKNESNPTLIIKRSVQLERTLGYTDDSTPSQVQAEYLIRALANNLKVDMKTADIVRLELDFLANKNELRSGATGVKTGTRLSIADSDAFNSTSDVAFTKMAIVTPSNSAPSPLFAFFTDLSIDLKNNLKQNKAVSVLGAFDSTPGFFQVAASVTAYFTDVAEMQAVIDNDSVTIETHLVKFNKGITIDLPLVVMSKAMADVKLNEPVMIPLASDAATAKLIDPNLDYTMLWVFWDFLPNLAG